MMKKDFYAICSNNSTAIDNNIMPASSSVPILLPTAVDTQNTVLSKNILHKKITNIFMLIGIPAHVNGYHFLREAIQLVVGNFDMLNGITKKLYPMVASHFSTSAYIVERSIRNAIEIAYNRGKLININIVFGFVVLDQKDKPSNSELIALLAEKVYMDCR